mgnify:CR=1 FL=1
MLDQQLQLFLQTHCQPMPLGENLRYLYRDQYSMCRFEIELLDDHIVVSGMMRNKSDEARIGSAKSNHLLITWKQVYRTMEKLEQILGT